MISPYPSGASTSTQRAYFGSLRVRLHVEGLHGGGIAVHHDGTVELRGDVGLVGRAEVVAVLEGIFEQSLGVRVVEHRYGVVVARRGKGALMVSSLEVSRRMTFRSGARRVEHAVDDEAQELLGEFHQAVEIAIGDFRLDHPELGEMAAGLGFFGAKSWAEGVDLAQRERGALDVELAALREVGFVSEVFNGKERAGAFAGRRREDGRIGEDEAALVEEVARSLDDFGADAQDRGLARRANPEMAVLHQEVGAVLLERDGEGRVFGHALDDFDAFDV